MLRIHGGQFLGYKKEGHLHVVNGLCWRSPPGRRESLLSGRWGCLTRLRRGAAGSVGHQFHIHPAIHSTAVPRLVRVDWLILAQANLINLVGWDLVLRRQILNYGIGAALTEAIVVIRRTDGIRTALDGDDVAL